MDGFEHLLLLLIMVMALSPVAARWDLPLPVLLVIGGMLLAPLPLPKVAFDPELVFLIFVPPLLYYGALTSSGRELNRYRRAIGLLALGSVAVTIVAVAAVAHVVVPDLPWLPAIILGAMVAPPDAAVTLAITRRLGLPRPIVTILEGETLFNDLLAFIAFRVAIAGVMAGTISWWSASAHLVGGALGGVAIGWAVAYAVVFIRRFLPEPRVANTLSLATPFAAYLPAEWAHASSVLAVVTTGLILGRIGPRVVPAQVRLQSQQLWDVVLFMLNGLIFVLIGEQLGAIIESFIHHWDEQRFLQMLAISAVVIVVRVVWVFPATYLPRLMSRKIRESDPLPDWRGVGIVAWTGIRGGDTLVTALALPLATPAGEPFPGRDAIQAIAFGVILSTLVVQGLTLRPLIRWCGLRDDHAEQHEEAEARQRISAAGSGRLDDIAHREALPKDVVERIRIHHHLRRHVRSGGEPPIDHTGSSIIARHLLRINRDVLKAEREMLVSLRDDGVIADDVLRKLQREIDLEEVVMERSVT